MCFDIRAPGSARRRGRVRVERRDGGGPGRTHHDQRAAQTQFQAWKYVPACPLRVVRHSERPLSPPDLGIRRKCIPGRLDGCRCRGDTWRLNGRTLPAHNRDALGVPSPRGNTRCPTGARAPLDESNDTQQTTNGFSIWRWRWIKVFDRRERTLESHCGIRVTGATNR